MNFDTVQVFVWYRPFSGETAVELSCCGGCREWWNLG